MLFAPNTRTKGDGRGLTRRIWSGRPLWWYELILVSACYWLYAMVRDIHGQAEDQSRAFANGHGLESAENATGLNFERSVQQFFLHCRWLLRAMGGFYGGAHFVVTFGVLVWLLWRRPEQYRRWRRLLGITTAAGVFVFALFPVAPPRLIPGTGVEDSLDTVGGLWSYNRGVLEHIADPYAAMPSLHLGWSTWVALTLASTVGAGWSLRKRALFAIYPGVVTVIVLATGTHWFVDTLAGVALTLTVWAADILVRRIWRRWHPEPLEAAGPYRGVGVPEPAWSVLRVRGRAIEETISVD